MRIRFGFELAYSCEGPASMVLALSPTPGDGQRLLKRSVIQTEPKVRLHPFKDDFGNVCTRLEVPQGLIVISADGLLHDSGRPEATFANAQERAAGDLPADTLGYLLPSRYCESDTLAPEALRLFGALPPGWSRVQAICDFVNQHVKFGYEFARSTKTALETYQERQGVCRDFAHLTIAFCRALNIPARYVTSYLGDIGVPRSDAPMDFAACIEVYLGDRWHVFDPRNNARRIGRLIIARGRDAADVAISNTFGPARLEGFKVWTYQVRAKRTVSPQMKSVLAVSLLLGALGFGLALGRGHFKTLRS